MRVYLHSDDDELFGYFGAAWSLHIPPHLGGTDRLGKLRENNICANLPLTSQTNDYIQRVVPLVQLMTSPEPCEWRARQRMSHNLVTMMKMHNVYEYALHYSQIT